MVIGLFWVTGLSAQNFYVAIVKGKVTYNDEPLKPRDKIELRGNLRFGSPQDYVKISGPTGIHTIRPTEKEGGGYEFLRAVTAELFPAAKPLGSYVLSTHITLGDVVNIDDENQWLPEYFVSGERIPLKGILKKRDHKNLYWVYQTRLGTVYQSNPKLVRGELELAAADFQQHPPADSIVGDSAYLFLLRDQNHFAELLATHALPAIFPLTSPELGTADLATGEVVSLGAIPAGKVLPREAVMPDLLFNLLASGQQNVRCFLLPGECLIDAEGYASLLWEQYGQMNFSRVGTAFVHFLGEKRKADARYNALWKLNRNQ